MRKMMRNAALASAMLALAAAAEARTVSGPYDHGNLSIYLIHRDGSEGGAAPLSLEEALRRGLIEIEETGHVTELLARNVGDEAVFIQSGDVLKGGRQDRVIAVSTVVAPHSGVVPLDVWCVEAGRWSARDHEDSSRFSVSSVRLPSLSAAFAIQGGSGYGQDNVWAMVEDIQVGLSRSLEVDVRDERSSTSLQLTLENDGLRSALTPYDDSLGNLPGKHPDAVGYVFAVDGRIVGGEEFSSAGLFRSVWARQLQAATTEALVNGNTIYRTPPEVVEIEAFLDAALATEVRDAGDRWVHRTYLAQ